ncbi:unnamed protein product [Agarophyton chilense]
MASPAKAGLGEQSTGSFVSDDEEAPAPSRGPSYHNFSHRALALRLETAAAIGQLGHSPPEPKPSDFSLVNMLLKTIPKRILLVQILWSSIVMLISYSLAPDGGDSLSVEFWRSRLVVSSSVSYAVGWALFILLGFFIREASSRYWEAQLGWTHMAAYLRYVVRDLRQGFPAGSWHPGDLERIVGHLIAIPIALKMELRGEREGEQLAGVLCDADIDDVMAANSMHLHCSRVVRTYFSAAQDDALVSFQSVAMPSTPAGLSTQHLIMNNVDAIDSQAGILTAISNFSPSAGYVNHLEIFLYIWMFFLPLAVIETSGWFTVLWTVLVTYGVSMLFTIASALNHPFGHDIQDIKLNRMAAETSLQLLQAFSSERMAYTQVIYPQNDHPKWLEERCAETSTGEQRKTKRFLIDSLLSVLRPIYSSKDVALGVVVVLFWTTFVVFFTWGITRNEDNSTCRWWCVYIPVGGSTDSYVSLGVFLVLGFWLNDAYKRYSRGLEIWQSKLKPAIEEAAFRFAMSCSPGTWHHGDRERLFSHFAALPYAAKQMLRDTRDTTELHSILSAKDVAAFDEANDLFEHAMDVIYGYQNSLECGDDQTCKLLASPVRGAGNTVAFTLRKIEIAVHECVAMHRFPISQSFTTHLTVFAFFWLALLPLALVEFNGFLVFVYIVPISFSVLNLLKIGKDLADPFGFDEYDIPLQSFCSEIKHSIHDIYQNSRYGTVGFVHESSYSKDIFKPQEVETRETTSHAEDDMKTRRSMWKWLKFTQKNNNPSPLVSLVSLLDSVPSVRVRDMVALFLWSIIAVFTSYGLSFTWGDGKRNSCRGWCSPIDVDLGVLGNVGFALFMILAFRASDAIGRYESGARLIQDLKMLLRTLAIEICQNFRGEMFHKTDKERIIAHIVQIPLSFRDRLLSGEEKPEKYTDGLLSAEDKQRLETSSDRISYLLQTIEAYIILQDKKDREGHDEMGPFHCQATMVIWMLNRILTIRELTQRAFGVKRFPVVKSYTEHQHLFTIIWLILLPFAMTPKTGFFTILWTPIISYGVIGLEQIAVKLVDPYGKDSIDIPVEDICLETAEFILEGVRSTQWDCHRLIGPSAPDSEADLGIALRNQKVTQQLTVPRMDESFPSEFGEPVFHFDKLEKPRVKPCLYSHLLNSVPWKGLMFIVCYTTLAVVLSYISRDRSEPAKWWLSRISIDTSIATYVSFAAFLLLGFYVNAAFDRCKDAGISWADTLHSACHSLAVQFLTLFDDGAIHKGDHNRIIAFIACIPIVLKNQMRNSRDIREIKGLLSQEDLARVHCADNMSRYCVEVVKAYQLAAASRPEYAAQKITYGKRFIAMKREMGLLEKAAQQLIFLSAFPIAPGFVMLLNALLAIWFLILPFALAEISGWFTILWVSIIGYGVLGMYTIASEIEHPFGSDMNDLDLDSFARKIVEDVLFIRKNYRSGGIGLDYPSPVRLFWKEVLVEGSMQTQPNGFRARVLQRLKLAINVMAPLLTTSVIIWTVAAITFAWLVSQSFPFDDAFNDSCEPWFCSRIAIDSSVEEYVGFALFLLLGFRLYDSHWSGVWHPDDLERIAAHLAAFPIALMGQLRGKDYKEKYEEILCNGDVQKLLSVRERANYCLDLVENYLAKGDRISASEGSEYPASGQEVEYMWKYLQQLKESAFECERMLQVPLPYGYVQHLRIFMVIWLLLLPLGLVESSGWLTILWVVFVTYGVVGIERWASELSNPFGYDVSDIPMDDFVDTAILTVKKNLDLYRNGVRDIVESGRGEFVIGRTLFRK